MKKEIKFFRFKYLSIFVSGGLALTFLLIIILRGGFQIGIDFAGGVKLTAKFSETVDIGVVRNALAEKNISASVQQIGTEGQNEYLISTKLIDKKESTDWNVNLVKDAINAKYQNVTFPNQESVGPAIGDFLRKSAFKLGIWAMILMTLYLTFRFEFQYSVGAMVALMHDIIMSTLFCGAMGIDFDVNILAALLTIYGYSVNDTIVIFDRIREVRHTKSKENLLVLMNRALNQTLSRTLLTSMLTLFSVLALFFLGGDVIHSFATVMVFGLFIGTYSTIFIASPVVYLLHKHGEKRKTKNAATAEV